MAESSLPAATRPGRVSLAVEDPYAVSSFYRDVVGLEQLDRTADTATLGIGETPLLELVESDHGPRTDSQAGLYHVAFRYPSRTALGSALNRIEALYQLDGATDHGVTRSLYLTDPAGNGVELYADRPRSTWPTEDGEVRMRTDPLDLDALRAAGESGTDAPEGTRIGHVHLEVTDLASATAFYSAGLGLPVTREIGDMARFFATDGYHHHLGVTTARDRTDPATGRGIDWFEFVVPDREAIEAAEARFEEMDVSVADRDGGIAVADPDGIGVWLSVRN
ncbi:MAG: VOC family protein [Halodesulfurarchaeum sp.]